MNNGLRPFGKLRMSITAHNYILRHDAFEEHLAEYHFYFKYWRETPILSFSITRNVNEKVSCARASARPPGPQKPPFLACQKVAPPPCKKPPFLHFPRRKVGIFDQ